MSAAITTVFLVPFAGGIAAFLLGRRAQRVLGLLSALATTAAVGCLTRDFVQSGPLDYDLGGWNAPLGIHLRCDGLSLLLLLLTALICLLSSIYAALYFTGEEEEEQVGKPFWPLWLFLWGGLNCIFVSGDIFNLYLLLEFVLLASVALAALTGSRAALVAAFRYLVAASAAALFYLLGVALLYAEYSTLDLAQLRAAEPGGYLALLALALMSGGLALKSALFPLHFWLPPAHASAPAPVSALLSGLVVKAGFYVMLRLWYDLYSGLSPAAGQQAVATLGALAVLWGSVQAMRQDNLKMLVAYSTVAQMGYLFLLFPLAGTANDEAIAVSAYQIISHGLAKAGMFLAAGALIRSTHSHLLVNTRGAFRQAPWAILAILLAGANLAGIAPGGGAKAKLLEALLGAGQWWWAVVAGVGMLLTLGYTIAALRYSFLPAEHATQEKSRPSLGLLALLLSLLAMAFSLFSAPLLALLAWEGAP